MLKEPDASQSLQKQADMNSARDAGWPGTKGALVRSLRDIIDTPMVARGTPGFADSWKGSPHRCSWGC